MKGSDTLSYWNILPPATPVRAGVSILRQAPAVLGAALPRGGAVL